MAWGDSKVSRWGWKWMTATDRLAQITVTLSSSLSVFLIVILSPSIHLAHLCLTSHHTQLHLNSSYLTLTVCLRVCVYAREILARPLLLCCKLLLCTLFHAPFSEHEFGCLTLVYIFPVCSLSSESLHWRVETAKWEAHTLLLADQEKLGEEMKGTPLISSTSNLTLTQQPTMERVCVCVSLCLC